MKKKLNFIWVTFFYSGLVPKAPGTAGSLAAVPFCYATILYGPGKIFHFLLAILITLLAILGSAKNQNDLLQQKNISTKHKDPQYIVIDEVAGMFWSTLFVAPEKWSVLFLSFLLFRIFDILKPFPGNYFDWASKTAKTGLAQGVCIVLDDVIAGMYTALLVFILQRTSFL